ncbi:MAG: C-terminal helicase domain-containing protein, partial [Chloroflexi bacterium]|nr:C-terminal helicase domain-containing protein [Chloroflexota bacterium]
RLFSDKLAADLQNHNDAILALLSEHGPWRPEHDAKLQALRDLVTSTRPDRKILVFSQFADTVRYLERELPTLTGGASLALAAVTGDAADPSALARRFSPVSNEARDELSSDDEIRVLLATDVLSEGQNLQDCSVVVNYDLPWAIIRLIQRAGRVDRIGQKSAEILCYSFLPADGVEDIIELRKRILTRLRENAEVVGADEAFFEEEGATAILDDLYNERAGILDDEPDGEVDLASHAYQIWKDAVDADPAVEHAVAGLPDVSYSSREPSDTDGGQEGVLVFVRTPQGADMLTRVQADGNVTGGSQFEILAAAECEPETPAAPRSVKHHELVAAGVRAIVQREQKTLGHLGRPSSARHRAYVRLRDYAGKIAGQFDEATLVAAVEAIHRRPLHQSATNKINRQIRSEISDAALAELVIGLHNEDQLCVPDEGSESRDPRIICSLGLFRSPEEAI